MTIADVHAHIFPDKLAHKAAVSIGDFYDMTTHHAAAYQELVRQEAQAGISWCLASSAATSPKQAASVNGYIATVVLQDPQLVGMGSLYPTMEDWEPELERIQALGLKGIKIHPDFQNIPIDEPAAVPMYRAIARAGLPVLFHMGDDRYDYSAPERLTNLIRQVPDLIAIAAHFGGWRAWDRSYAHIQPENVFYDTSSSLMYLGKERALDFLDRAGAHRFLFGTDFPMWTPKEEVQRFLDLGLDETTRDRILFGNFEKLFLGGAK
ncbi:MAG: amidohydrolase family protein [Eubacteriales bacterium]|nr:amidohydrolase family protein [Eubacteriales bacterium]